MAQAETEPASVTNERIRSRILAEELFAFAESECAEAIGTPEFVTRFWSLLAAKVAEKIGSTVETPAPQSERQAKMTDAESKAFEQRECTFGAHNGKKFHDIPLGICHGWQTSQISKPTSDGIWRAIESWQKWRKTLVTMTNCGGWVHHANSD